MLRMGSLFSGIGGFELAARRSGITPVWASEIDPFCIAVTKTHFPVCTHLGDITRVDGASIEPVDIITGGSPCQDLSIAGKQKGLMGERSGLFLEMIRIINEMRRATNGRYPRYVLWENVPGAFSSNNGYDFKVVLEAFTGSRIPIPGLRGKRVLWESAGLVRGWGGSLAWRVLNAQYFGVPQRRRRIFLITDFRGDRAGEILFESKSVSGCAKTSGDEGQKIAGNPRSRPETTGRYWDGGQIADTLDVSMGSKQQTMPEKRRFPGVIVPTVSDQALFAFAENQRAEVRISDKAFSLSCTRGKPGQGHPVICLPNSFRVRRLTPLECERLQGFPDGWTDVFVLDRWGKQKKAGDTKRYKALGNAVAVPCVEYILKRI